MSVTTRVVDVADLAGKRCVVLGAGGFIGINLCTALIRTGARTVGFGRRSRVAQPADVTADAMAWIDGDFSRAADVAEALEGADIVFHLLGGSNPSSSNRQPAAEIQSMLGGNLSLIEAAVAAKVAKLVFVSSGGTVYGKQDGMPIPESAGTDPISAYGIGKLTTEKLLGLYHMIAGLDHAILRVANPFGPYQLPNRPQGVIATIMHRALTGTPIEIWGDGSVVRDYVYIDDLCMALLSAAVTPLPSRVVNIGSGIGRSLRQVVDDIARIAGREVHVVHRTGRAADIPANVLDITRARDQLGWEPRIAWEDGLVRTTSWIEAFADRPSQ